VVNNIPSGKARKFDVQILDSMSVVKYKGSATADVPTGETVSVPITLTRTSGNAVINGTIVEDSITVGYQFYRFVINTLSGTSLGGSGYGTCLTETHFLKGDTAYPKTVSDYTIVSNSPISGGSVAALFDGDVTVGASTGLYAKPISAPWEWVVDMHQAYTFNGMLMVCWETFFYGVPTSVTIYGSTSGTGPWTQVGAQTFTVAYSSVTIPLVY
jgi:hypothetical protein